MGRSEERVVESLARARSRCQDSGHKIVRPRGALLHSEYFSERSWDGTEHTHTPYEAWSPKGNTNYLSNC